MVTFGETTTTITNTYNNTAAAEVTNNLYNLQLQEGSHETTTEFVTAIAGVTGTLDSTTTMPEVLVSNRHFCTPGEYVADSLLAA